MVTLLLPLLAAAVGSTPPPDGGSSCGAQEVDWDYQGNDIRFASNVTAPSDCCALCLAEPRCAGYWWIPAAAAPPWGLRCYLKSSMLARDRHKLAHRVGAKVPGRRPTPTPVIRPPDAPPAQTPAQLRSMARLRAR
eukprot:SAG22_NODE_154_length_17189_cov_38.210064_1_plen_135_part_10